VRLHHHPALFDEVQGVGARSEWRFQGQGVRGVQDQEYSIDLVNDKVCCEGIRVNVIRNGQVKEETDSCEM
jgi:hypothetical protein